MGYSEQVDEFSNNYRIWLKPIPIDDNFYSDVPSLYLSGCLFLWSSLIFFTTSVFKMIKKLLLAFQKLVYFLKSRYNFPIL